MSSLGFLPFFLGGRARAITPRRGGAHTAAHAAPAILVVSLVFLAHLFTDEQHIEGHARAAWSNEPGEALELHA